MANGIYEIKIDVTGAPSGSDQLAQEKGQATSTEGKPPKAKKVSSLFDLLEQQVGEKRFKQIRATAGFGLGVGLAGVSIYQQNASFKGDSNTVVRTNEAVTWGTRALAAGGLIATGNYLGAGLYIGYTAFSLAKENRELINTRTLDGFQASYYQERLVNDISKRSR